MSEGDVKKAHVLAEFNCHRCGKPCNRLTIAPVVNGLIQSPAETPSGEIVCNDCNAKARDAEELRYEQDKQRRAWAKKNKHLNLKPKNGA